MEDKKDIVNKELNDEELVIEETVNEGDNEKIEEDTRNLKEKFYDKIAIPIKVLDVVIVIAVLVLVIMIIYFIVRKYS